jgi:hypothetical protein
MQSISLRLARNEVSLCNKRIVTALENATKAHIDERQRLTPSSEGEDSGATDTSSFDKLNNIATGIAGECHIISEIISYIARYDDSILDQELLHLREAVMATTERVRQVIYLIDDVCCEAIFGLDNIVSKYRNRALLYQIQCPSNVMLSNL